MSSQIAPHMWLPEPQLSFHPDRTSDREVHPLRGLLRFGPYTSGMVPDPIRVATLAPAGESGRLYGFMRELNSVYKPTERKDYLPEWPGFRSVFGLNMRGAGGSCHVELDTELEAEFESSTTPHIVLADRLVPAIQGLEAHRTEHAPNDNHDQPEADGRPDPQLPRSSSPRELADGASLHEAHVGSVDEVADEHAHQEVG